jgi:sulfopyruvate decarboxylase subunit beta
MTRLDALRRLYPKLEDAVVVTIMGAVSAELQSIGHRPNFFYLQHAMGLASSMGLGIALSRPERTVVVFDGDGSILMNLGSLTTLARYRPENLVHVVFDNESLLARVLTTIVAKVDAVGPSGYVTELAMLENRFEFQRWLRQH